MSNPEPQEEKKLTHDPRYHWDREEHIILLDVYLRYRPQFPSSESNEIQEISRLLRQYHPQKGNPIHEKLRNGDGVYMKMMNFRRFDPTTESKGLPKGNKLEETIWNEYYDRQEELKAKAELIKRSIKEGNSFPDNDHLDEPEMQSEGRVIGTIHKRHERSKKNKDNKIKDFKNKNTRVICEACGFDFEEVYGERGLDFCEIHHEVPVSEMKQGEKTKLKDLRCVCPNCHRMIHRRKPWLSVEELKLIMSKQTSSC